MIVADLNIPAITARLRFEIISDLKTLQIVSNGNLQSNEPVSIKLGAVHYPFEPIPDTFLIQREINKCFKSVMGSIQDYIDKLIGYSRIAGRVFHPIQGSSIDDVKKMLNDTINEEIMKVSMDRKLIIPEKLKIVLGDDIETIKTLQGYFDIRNGLEHHKGLAKFDKTIRYNRLALVNEEDVEIIEGSLVKNLRLKSLTESITYDKGGNIILYKDQVEGILLNILIFILPRLEGAIIKTFNEKRPQAEPTSDAVDVDKDV